MSRSKCRGTLAGPRGSHGRWGDWPLGRWAARIPFLVLALALAGSPRAAEAQHYQAFVEESAYQPLPIPGGGPVETIDGGDFKGWSYTPNWTRIDFPFPVGFYGERHHAAHLLGQGVITFDLEVTQTDTTRRMREIPGSTGFHNFIAAWWDQLTCNQGDGGPVKTQVVGSAPNRRFVIEWNHCRRYLSSGNEATFQVWLSEASDEVELHYGPITHAASSSWQAGIGVENADGSDGTMAAACTPNCDHSAFPTDRIIRFSSGPALQVLELEGSFEGFAGLPFPFRYTLSNPGSKPAESFTVEYWVSPEPRITGDAISLGTDERSWSLDPQQAEEVYAEPRLPIDLPAGQHYLLVEADPQHRVDVSNRVGTIAHHGPFELGIRAANLAVGWVEAPELATPGEEVAIRWLARNTGNLVANSIPYRVGIERSAFLSPTSPTLGGGTIDTLEMGGERIVETRVTLPPGIEPGTYHLGVELDPDRVLFEHERLDNGAVSLPVTVSRDALAVVTKSLPAGHIQGSYERRLVAAGGDGFHHWTLAEGAVLPPGLSLVVREAENGELATFLEGQPSAVGTFSFTLVVSSAGLEVSQDYELTITSPAYPLTIVSEVLAQAAFGFDYRDELAASGGVPPYTWEVLFENELPHGVLLRSDGVLSGRPLEDGRFSPSVRVTDSEGRQATRTFDLDVAPPAALTCVTQELPPLAIDEFVQLPLLAAGGRKRPDDTYLWTSSNLMRLAQELGEVSGRVEEELGLQLDPSGMVYGQPQLFGTFLWTLRVYDDTPGSAGVDCPVVVRIPRDRGLSVVTQQLPTAYAGQSYRAQLEASGGDGGLRWSEYGGGQILEELGLSVDATGTLVGTPSLDALEGEPRSEFAITLRVEDEKGRIGIGVVNLELKTAAPASGGAEEEAGGCQTGGGAPAGWAIALLGLALLRRR